jgi:hypothetical protein
MVLCGNDSCDVYRPGSNQMKEEGTNCCLHCYFAYLDNSLVGFLYIVIEDSLFSRRKQIHLKILPTWSSE